MGKKEQPAKKSETLAVKIPAESSRGEVSQEKKQFLLRLSDSLWKELSAWAEDDFRSINGQIEFLLNECVKKRKKK